MPRMTPFLVNPKILVLSSLDEAICNSFGADPKDYTDEMHAAVVVERNRVAELFDLPIHTAEELTEKRNFYLDR